MHNVEGIGWVLEAWKAPSLDVRSRCGFCGITLDTWTDREDHLADHFRLGHTMANWTGGWGFEKHVMDTVESYMPPCKCPGVVVSLLQHYETLLIIRINIDVIDYDRKSPFPFMASGRAPSSPRSAYELISLELAFFLHQHFNQMKEIPSNRDLRLQACRVIFASEALVPSHENDGSIAKCKATSWLRDLITSDSEVAREARFGPLRSQAESRLATLRINGKKSLFEECPLEKQLRDFVQCSWEARSVVPLDSDLQRKVCNIIASTEDKLETKTPDFVVNWLTKLVATSSEWLGAFKERTYLLPPPTKTVHSVGSGCQPPAIEGDWVPISHHVDSSPHVQPFFSERDVAESLGALTFSMPFEVTEQLPNLEPSCLNFGSYVLNDANYHRWLDVELKQWAMTIMSLDSPERRIPSDEEIQHQARVLLYGE